MKILIATAVLLSWGALACSTLPRNSRTPAGAPPVDLNSPISLGSGESLITIVGTNDVHGHFLTEATPEDADEFVAAPSGTDPEKQLGGQQWFAGYVSAIRSANDAWYGKQGTTLLLDAGDVAQGTLISNSNEGMLAVELMNSIGYTAAIPGNHAYDFGPVDPQVDQCPLEDTGCDPLGALKQFQEALDCPLLAANVKLADHPAETAPFLKDYTLVPFEGRNIAVIGLDNAGTPSTTYRMNVKSLLFTSGIQETQAIVQDLKSKGLADVFVLVAHNGDMANDSPLLSFLDALPQNADGTPLLDAAIVGHTHIKEQGIQNGIPYIQSVWGGKYFGIIQLVVTKDPATGRLIVEHDKTREKAAIPILPEKGQFMGQPVEADSKVSSILSNAEKTVDELANEKIGVLQSSLPDTGKRLTDSVIGNFVADMMNSAAGSDVAVIGSGDVRMGIAQRLDNNFIYSDLFNVLPKGLQLVDIPAMPVGMLNANLVRSIQTCGERGALQVSGIEIYFRRDCSHPVKGLDPNAKLVRVVSGSGEILYPPSAETVKTVHVSTTDFVLTGGAGYTSFMKLIATPQGLASINTLGPLRTLMIRKIGAIGVITSGPYSIGRYINCDDAANAKLPECGS